MKIILTNKNKAAVSLFAAVATVAAMWGWLTHEETQRRAQQKMTTVLVAKKYIPGGKTLDEALLQETLVPAAYAQPSAIQSKSELLDENGRPHFRARIGLLKGEQITTSKLHDDKSAAGLAWVLSPGQTAFSLRLPVEKAVGGLIQPGDWVHVINVTEKSAQMLFSPVRVIALQDRIIDAAPTEKATIESSTNDTILVTIGVTPAQATAMAWAVERGRIALALTAPINDIVKEP
jgi:pilus assembly protein CpaB